MYIFTSKLFHDVGGRKHQHRRIIFFDELFPSWRLKLYSFVEIYSFSRFEM